MGGMESFVGLTERIIAAAMRVHSVFGPGLLESVYETCLAWELQAGGHRVEAQKPLPLVYRGRTLNAGFRLDLVVDESVIVEIKNVARIEPVHTAQTITYLRV